MQKMWTVLQHAGPVHLHGRVVRLFAPIVHAANIDGPQALLGLIIGRMHDPANVRGPWRARERPDWGLFSLVCSHPKHGVCARVRARVYVVHTRTMTQHAALRVVRRTTSCSTPTATARRTGRSTRWVRSQSVRQTWALLQGDGLKHLGL